MSDNSPLLVLLILVVLLVGLGYGGSELVKQLQAATAAVAASTARPYGTDTGPGWIYVPPDPADKDEALAPGLRMFLLTFEVALDALSSRKKATRSRR